MSTFVTIFYFMPRGTNLTPSYPPKNKKILYLNLRLDRRTRMQGERLPRVPNFKKNIALTAFFRIESYILIQSIVDTKHFDQFV